MCLAAAVASALCAEAVRALACRLLLLAASCRAVCHDVSVDPISACITSLHLRIPIRVLLKWVCVCVVTTAVRVLQVQISWRR